MMHLILAIVAGALNFVIQILPVRLAVLVARGLGDIIYIFSRKRKRIAMENVEKAFGDALPLSKKKEIVRASFQNTALSIMDLFTTNKIKKRAPLFFNVRGMENYEKALQGKRGVVLVSSHLGSWEYLAFLFYLTKTQGSVVVKDLSNPYINYRLDQARRQTGLNPISKKNSIRQVIKELRAAHTVAILIDQWAGRDGLWQEFFGVMTSTTSLPARLAKRTECCLLPAFCLRRKNGRFDIEIHPPLMPDTIKELSEDDVTRQLNQILEEKILQNPRQWSWAHRRWKPKPEEMR